MARKTKDEKMGYAEKKTFDYILEHGEATATELYRISSNRVEPLNSLINKKKVFVSPSDHKYRIFEREKTDIFIDFFSEVAARHLAKVLDEIKKPGILTNLVIDDPEILDYYRGLLPDFKEILREKGINAIYLEKD